METLFMTIIAAFAFIILIAKLASAAVATDHRQNRSIRDALEDDLKSSKTDKSVSKRKGTKKVRFAVDHDEFVVNKAVAGQSEAESIVFEKNCSEIEDDCDVNSAKLDEGMVICDENVCMKLLCDDGIDEAEKEKEGLISEEDDSSDDDWEGVERSDLEKVFAMAADYGRLDDGLQSLGSDVQMQLYALHKVATEGPCREAQPMALKNCTRNSWQKLGNMNPDVAMEKYIALLSEVAPGWSQGIHSFLWLMNVLQLDMLHCCITRVYKLYIEI
ncbi:putative acyl-CoA-binding protein, ACBP [Helianthus annuus]|nr:putative acyl-CoA-binding protein, ACBP [Helianthus annuus]